jgi:hypothetical protein
MTDQFCAGWICGLIVGAVIMAAVAWLAVRSDDK